MKNLLFLFFGIFLIFACQPTTSGPSSPEEDMGQIPKNDESMRKPDYVLVIHGGAGTVQRENLTPEKEKAYTQALDSALQIGAQILEEGGASLDAIEATLVYLENNPLFNAGKGAVFTHDGKNELDASIMDGSTKMAGAVGGVSTVKNPIRLARKVMEESPHVLLTGKGAEAFAKEQGIEEVDPSYFFTQKRFESLKNAQKRTGSLRIDPDKKFGTVGAVALDKSGNLAAGTSTGGMTNKKYNRLGDSPIIGAGTYADNQTCAVSCTGHGEYFIRYAVAYDMAARLAYQQQSVKDAANSIIFDVLKPVKGQGGLIALDKDGNVAMPFNTPGMLRGMISPDEKMIGID